MKKAVALLSGGLDSSTALAIAKAEGYNIYALTFDYGQRHRIELEAAAKISRALEVEKHLVISCNLRDIGGSALTDDIEVPKGSDRGSETIPITYVPARNTIFLSFALAWAEVLEAGDIFIGVNAVDYSGYPDCRPEYLKAFEHMANLAVKAAVEGMLKFKIHSPLLTMSKSDIIKTGYSLGLDYALTWSCYDPVRRENVGSSAESQYISCGICDSCLFRKKGFKEAGIKDPLEYAF